MNLVQGLRLQSFDPSTPPRLSLVGAGGKSSALFRLARLLPPPVLVTATTHLSSAQAALADQVLIVQYPSDLTVLDFGLAPGVTLLIGPLVEPERLAGLNPLSIDRLHLIADHYSAPFLVEADGSRRLPLKAPAPHEPPIPGFADCVVVVAGLSALGQPIDSTHVHRPERFAPLAGAELGQPVTPAMLARVLSHPDGGLKNIPPGARRVCLLNQADTPALEGAGHAIARLLMANYHAVLVSCLLHPPGEEVRQVHERAAGVVLAAGELRRFGQPKQLLDWHGEPFVRRVARQALEARLDPVVVVTGAYREEIELALQGLPVKLAYNPRWQQGQSSSLSAGLAALPTQTGACIFLLSDQPHIPAALLTALVYAHANAAAHAWLPAIAAPQVNGRRANPVLFDRRTFPALMALRGDTGGRQLFDDPQTYPVAWVPWSDPSILLDVDTLQDYDELNKL